MLMMAKSAFNIKPFSLKLGVKFKNYLLYQTLQN